MRRLRLWELSLLHTARKEGAGTGPGVPRPSPRRLTGVLGAWLGQRGRWRRAEPALRPPLSGDSQGLRLALRRVCPLGLRPHWPRPCHCLVPVTAPRPPCGFLFRASGRGQVPVPVRPQGWGYLASGDSQAERPDAEAGGPGSGAGAWTSGRGSEESRGSRGHVGREVRPGLPRLPLHGSLPRPRDQGGCLRSDASCHQPEDAWLPCG